ncbi:MAG: FGGY-family carbohydrate kinase [Anaerolineales bacterium]|jgi:xylulokinase
MPNELLLGIDIGTYESKGTLATTSGQVVANAAVGHDLSIPHPGWAEHDAEEVWWHDFVTLCRRLLATPEVDASRVAAVGVSAIAPCVLPIDSQGKPLRPGILYGVDTRAHREIANLENLLGREAIFANSGLHLSSQAAGPKIVWIRNQEPQVWGKTDMILTGSGYLVFKLTGERVIDIYTATAYAPMLDIQRRQWKPEMTKPVMPMAMLPRLLWSVDVAGHVTRQASQQTGLVAGTPVIAGTADAAAEALSAGLSHPGDLMLMYGSSLFFIQKTSKLVSTERLWGALFLEPGSYAVAAGMSTSGSLTRWFRDNLAPEERADEAAGGPNAYATLAGLAGQSPRCARGLLLLPYFSGERTPINDPQARGLIMGLTLSHTRADLYRAILEGVGFGIRHNIDAMREEGVPPARILAVGGGTENPLWLQIVSDIAGIEQYVPNQNYGASYGDAFLAGVGVGLFEGTNQVTDWIRYRTVLRPDPIAQEQYEPYYEIYRDLYQQTAESMHRLAELTS